jgi:small subunit ribosomal protein S4
MKLGPKYKICKRLGAQIFEKCQTQKFALASESAAPKRGKGGMRGGSAFGLQLKEKQKARFMYGISESQFFRYVQEAMERKGADSARELVSRLEARLDNVVFRMGLATTRRQARQLVSHGHITVDGRRMNIPSYKVGENEVVALRDQSRSSALFAVSEEKAASRAFPSWLSGVEGKTHTARIAGTPQVAPTELLFDPAVIIQFYSR